MKLKTIFRYPGGKTKLMHLILARLKSIRNETSAESTFVDVFVGGGSVAIGIANQFPNAKIAVNDLDKYIHAFWSIMCSKQGLDELVGYVEKYKKPTVEDFMKLRQETTKENVDDAMLAFLAIFFNRTTFSGIFTSGPIGGIDQSGDYKIGCRYNASTMTAMIRLIANSFSSNETVCSRSDFLTVIDKYKDNQNAILYLDPPYMKQGKQLYNHHMQPKDYGAMADALKVCKARWIVSHDDYPDFVKLFDGWTDIQTIEGVPYTINSIKDNRKTELLISKKI